MRYLQLILWLSMGIGFFTKNAIAFQDKKPRPVIGVIGCAFGDATVTGCPAGTTKCGGGTLDNGCDFANCQQPDPDHPGYFIITKERSERPPCDD